MHKRSRTCCARMRDSHGAGLWFCCWDKGGNTHYPEHQICRKANALSSYTERRINFKNGFGAALNFFGLLRPWWLLMVSRFAKQHSVSRWGLCYRVFKFVTVCHSCWQPPKPAEPWSGILDATKESPICVQRGLFPTDSEARGQEDCLYLNVYTPRVKRSIDGRHYCIIFLP